MTARPLEQSPETDRLIQAVIEKLEANRLILAKSIEFGRLSWRKTRNGEIEVDLEPKL